MGRMTAIRYRALTAAEVPEACEVYFTARNDMQVRTGGTAGPRDLPGMMAGYSHLLQTGIFRVAEVDGRIGGLCTAIVRDDLWFLSGFWVLPELQGHGIGGPLLRQVFEAGQAAGARRFCVWASSDLPALGSYMKLGMMPRYQIMTFAGEPSQVPDAPAGYATVPLTPEAAAAVDRAVRSTGREMDHRFFLTEDGAEGRQVVHGDKLVGYYYRHGSGIGAAAWTEPEHGVPLVHLALREAAAASAAGGGPVRLIAHGANHVGIKAALGAGLRLARFSHFLSTEPVGKPEQYLPSGPLLY
jgi:GNAT superfamily N-acetyltransferase